MAFRHWHQRSPWQFVRVGLFAGAILAPGMAPIHAAESARKSFFARDVHVITVTDFTDEGKKLPEVSPAAPVYCVVYDLAYTDFGPSWAGIKKPRSRPLLVYVIDALAAQGYLIADELHPPTQALFFAWGALQGGTGARVVAFLGGEKLDLMWDFAGTTGGNLDPAVLRRGMRTPLQNKVMDIARHDLYLCVVRSYDPKTIDQPDLKLFWETRFACPADGLKMSESLPLMILAAARSLGVETVKPVSINASKEFEGTVEYGELETIGVVEPEEPAADSAPAPEPQP